MGGTGPENLNLVELDQPVDELTRPNQGPRRPYRQVRFRPPRGFAGSEPEFFEGNEMGQWRGDGTDSPSDVGCPASIQAAWRRRRVPKVEAPAPTMPEAKVERDQDEQSTMETQQQFYDMQQR
jgi:hypothetical protein